MAIELSLKSKIIVDRVIRGANNAGYFAGLLHKGYDDRGLIYIKTALSNRKARIFGQTRNNDNKLAWHCPLGDIDAVFDEQKIDTYIRQTRKYDEDCWIIEIEDMKETYPLPPNEAFWP